MRLSSGHLLLAVIIAVLIAAMFLQGCAYYEVDRETGSGNSWGFLRSLTVTETTTYDKDGNVQAETVTISTESTTGDVLMGINEIGNTLVDGYQKVKP